MFFQPRLDILPMTQRKLWDELHEVPVDFTLYGGTALHLGHRQSVDFDFFTTREPSGSAAGSANNFGTTEISNRSVSMGIDGI